MLFLACLWPPSDSFDELLCGINYQHMAIHRTKGVLEMCLLAGFESQIWETVGGPDLKIAERLSYILIGICGRQALV